MKVIVPISNTTALQPLIDALIGMSWHEGTQIQLMTVAPRWVEYTAAQVTIPAALHELEALTAEIHTALPHCKVSFTTRMGDEKTEIVDCAKETEADLILMGGDAIGLPDELSTGSVIQAVLAHSHCPVLVARSMDTPLGDVQSGFKSVLIPVDNSVYADAAMQWLLNFRWSDRTKFFLASVIQHENAFDLAEKNLQERKEILAPALGRNLSHDVVVGNPTVSIMQLARKHGADLIVIGSHARTGIHKLLLGCVSEDLAHRAPCSVAVIRGILPKDDSWLRTGVFFKPKVVDEVRAEYPSHSAQENFHSVPTGMH